MKAKRILKINYDDKWDELVKYRIIRTDEDTWLNQNDFKKTLKDRDPKDRIEDDFVKSLWNKTSQSKIKEHLLEGTKLVNEINKETDRVVELLKARLHESIDDTKITNKEIAKNRSLLKALQRYKK